MNINTNFKKLWTPSLFILLAQIAVIQLTYSTYIPLNNSYIHGIITSIIALITIPFICTYSIPIKKTASIFILLYLSVLIVTCAGISFLSYLQVRSVSGTHTIDFAQKKQGIFTATVTKVIHKRYNQEVYISFDPITAHEQLTKAISSVAHSIAIHPGDRIAVFSRPRCIAGSKTPGPYQLSLLRRGIKCRAYLSAKNFAFIHRTPVSFRYKIKQHILSKTDSLFAPRLASFLKALYFGNKHYISKKTLRYYKNAGVIHVLAASGLHVCIVSTIPLLLLGLFRINKRIIFSLTIAVLACYLYITDLPVSLMRASIMFGIFTFRFLFSLEKNSFNSLYLSAIIILALFPHELYSIGFHLSFGATMGILLFYDIFKNTFSYMPRLLANSFSITCAAQVFVLPLLYIQMDQLNLVGVVTNLITVPLVSILFAIAIMIQLFALLFFNWASLLTVIVNIIFDFNDLVIKNLSNLGGHFTINKHEPVLLLFFLLTLIPLIPWKNKRKLFSTFIYTGYICAWLYCNSIGKMNHKQFLKIKHAEGITSLTVKPQLVRIHGPLPPVSGMFSLIQKIRALRYDRLTVQITSDRYNEIKKYAYLVKKIYITECLLPQHFRLRNHMQRFIKLLAIDNITLKINKK